MKPIQKQKAKELYLNSAKTLTEIANELGIHNRTLYRWIRAEVWDRSKPANSIYELIIRNMLAQLQNLQQNIASRPVEKQFPTLQETKIIDTLVASIFNLHHLDAIEDTPPKFRKYEIARPHDLKISA